MNRESVSAIAVSAGERVRKLFSRKRSSSSTASKSHIEFYDIRLPGVQQLATPETDPRQPYTRRVSIDSPGSSNVQYDRSHFGPKSAGSSTLSTKTPPTSPRTLSLSSERRYVTFTFSHERFSVFRGVVSSFFVHMEETP